jgi:hypothetical protein
MTPDRVPLVGGCGVQGQIRRRTSSPPRKERQRASGRARNRSCPAVETAASAGVLQCSVALDIVTSAGIASIVWFRSALDWPEPRKTTILCTLERKG